MNDYHERMIKLNMHERRIKNYKTACFWGFFGMIGACANFWGKIIKLPEPAYVIYNGVKEQYYNPWYTDVYEDYDYVYNNAAEETDAIMLKILAFALTIMLALAIVGICYLLFVYVLEKYFLKHVEFNQKYDDKKAKTIRKSLIGLVVVFYCVAWLGLISFDGFDVHSTKSTQQRTEEMEFPEDEEFDKIYNHEEDKDKIVEETPMDRGYPSNDLQYYIDHPNEPMPEEIINEVLAPSSYDEYYY